MTRPAADPPREPGPDFYYGPAMVAEWLGVSRAALGNWLRRYDDFPAVAAVVVGPKMDSWCWRYEQRTEWVQWAHDHDVACNPKAEEE